MNKLKGVILIVFTIFALTTRGQDNNCDVYLTYFKNEKLCANRIYLEKPPFQAQYIQADSLRINPDLVKLYKNSSGLYVNTKNLTLSGLSNFAERVETGKVNLYSYTKDYYNPQTGPGKLSKFYVNKGADELYKAKVKNLKKLLRDDSESMKHLKKYTTFNWVAGGIGLAGLTAGIIGALPHIKNFSDTDPSTPDPEVSPLMIGGFAVALAANFSFYLRPNPYKAIKIYNSKSE